VIQVLSSALEVDPRNPRLLRYLSAGARMRRDYARDVQFCSRAVALDPASEIDAVNLGQAIIEDKGDVSAALHVADAVPAELQNTQSMIEHRVWLLTLGRDFAAAEKVVKSLPQESWRSNWREPLLLGDVRRSLGQEKLAQESFQQAYTLLKAAIANDSEEPMVHADLADVCSRLGLSEEALREADHAIVLQPVEKDAFAGPQWLLNRAGVNLRLGRPDEAIKFLEELVTASVNTISAWELKLDPVWDSLRSNPRFQKLVALEESKETH
jgi:tetratricopeptide (TPR) repeat protein